MEVVSRSQHHVRLRGDLPLSAERVFAALTEPNRLVTWWPDEAEVDLRVGGPYRLAWPKQDWTLRGRFLEVRAPARLRFTWSWDHDDIPERTVTMDLVGSADRTELTIHHTCGSEEEGQSYIEGWQFFVSRLVS